MFQSARIRLTLWYLLIIMMVSAAFSVALYRIITVEFDRFERAQRFRIERRLQEENEGNIRGDGALRPTPFNIPISSPELIQETRERVIIMLLETNLAVLFLSGLLGYLLAGITLKPIQRMVDDQYRFITDASHEFKTPITSLKTAFEVFLRNPSWSKQEAHILIQESLEEVQRLQELSSSLLELSASNVRQQEAQSVQTLVKLSLLHLKTLAREKDLTIQGPSTNLTIMGVQSELVRLFVIVFDNACKYSKKHSRISYQIKKSGTKAIISIEDHGIGIDQKDLPHIFKRFYRSDSARSHEQHGGYGLGLALAKNIVSQHHGEIHITSTLGKGTICTISLPLA